MRAYFLGGLATTIRNLQVMPTLRIPIKGILNSPFIIPYTEAKEREGGDKRRPKKRREGVEVKRTTTIILISHEKGGW
jgi:hypothetical protein